MGTFRGWEGIEALLSPPWGHPACVVLEKFALRRDLAIQQAGSEMPTCEVIGVVKFLCHTRNIPLVLQRPADQAKDLFTEPMLREMGFKWSISHELSCIRHLCYYLNQKKDDWIIAAMKRQLDCH